MKIRSEIAMNAICVTDALTRCWGDDDPMIDKVHKVLTTHDALRGVAKVALINYQDRIAALKEEKADYLESDNDWSDAIRDLNEQIKHYQLCLKEVREVLK